MNKQIQVLLADDEELALKEMQYILEQNPQIVLQMMCTNGEEALKNILLYKPDVVILDINMPGINGLTLCKMLNQMQEKPYLIFATAYQEHAVEALNLGAQGYILKPFFQDSVEAVMAKAIDSICEKPASVLKEAPQKLAAQEGNQTLFFDQNDILAIFARNRKTYFLVGDDEWLCKYTLVDLEQRIDMNLFFRTHRNYIVNLNKVKDMVPWFNNTYLIHVNGLKKTFEIPLSRDNIKSFKAKMNL